MEDEDVLEENSIEDLLDDSAEEEVENEGVLGDITTKVVTKKEDEEELLSSELEFGEDPEYDDSVDDFDSEEEYSI